jgi:heme/copper-type cytochrome/quinol oxidase subunit 4
MSNENSGLIETAAWILVNLAVVVLLYGVVWLLKRARKNGRGC